MLQAADNAVSLTVNGNGDGAGNGDITLRAANPAATRQVETLNIKAEGSASSFAVTAPFTNATINIEGDANLTLDGNAGVGGVNAFAGVSNVNASTATGNVTVFLNNNATAVVMQGGAGADTMSSLGTGNDNLSGGEGNDTLGFAAGVFNANDTVAGGNGTDTLTLTGDGVNQTADAAFANVTSIEVLDDVNANDLRVVLGANAQAAGVTTIGSGSTNGNANLTVTVGAGFTNALTVNASNGGAGDVFNAQLSAAAITYQGTETDVAVDNVSGGTTANDVIRVTLDGNGANLSNFSGFERLTLVAAANPAQASGAITLGDGTIRAGSTFVVDASGLTNSNAGANVSAAADTDGNVSITGGAGADTFALTGNGGDFVSGGDGNDTISGAVANDTVQGGNGTDTLQLASGANFTSVAAAAVSGIEVLSLSDDGNAAAVVGNTVTIADGFLSGNGAASLIVDASNVTNDDTVSINASALTATNSIRILGSTETAGAGDTLTGGAGNDTFVFTAANLTAADRVVGNGGTDTVEIQFDETGSRINELGVNSTTIENVTVTDFTADNTQRDLTLNMGEYGGTGTVTVSAAAITASPDGLLANTDRFVFDGGSNTGGGGVAQTAARFNVTGGAGNDTLTGAAAADTLIGGDGADQLTGGAGADQLTGGAGNDLFVVGATFADFSTTTGGVTTSDTVQGGEGNDTLQFGGNVTLTATNLANVSSIEVLDLNGTGANSVTLTDALYTSNGAAITVDAAGAGSVTVNGSALTGTNAVAVNATAAGADSLVGGAANDTFTFIGNDLQATDTITGGNGTDTIQIDANGNDEVSILGASVTGVERVVVMGYTANGTSNDQDVLLTATAYAGTGTLTVDASALVADVATGATDDFTFNAAGVANTATFNVTGGAGADTLTGGNGSDSLTGGAGADQITGGQGVDVLSGGAGDDVFVVNATNEFSNIGATETVQGGEGNDTLRFTTKEFTLSNVDLGAINSIETIEVQVTDSSVLLTDAVFTANGSSTLAINDGGKDITLTVNAASLSAANSVQVTLDGTTKDTVNGGAGNDTITITTAGLSANSTITGGLGTDTLSLDGASAGAVTHALNGVTGIEVISLNAQAKAANTDVIINVAADTVVAAGATLTADFTNTLVAGTATAFTGDVVFNGAAELDGHFVITGGAGNDTLTGGAVADTLSGGAGDDSLVGGAGVDVLSGGDGADTVTGGNGADTITLGAGADVVVYTAVAQSSGANVDSITDFVSGEDRLNITLDYTGNVSDLTINTAVSSAAGLSAAQTALTGERGQVVYDTTNSQLYINVNNDNLVTALDYSIGINAATTPANTVASGDLNFTVTTGTGNDLITTGAGADTITAGAGADTINGGAGADTIDVGAAGDVDVIRYTANADAGVAGTLNAAAGDSIVNFDAAGSDLIAFTGDFLTASMAGTSASAVNAVGYNAGLNFDGAGTGTDVVQLIAAGAATATLADLLTLADLQTAIGTLTNVASGDERILAFISGDGNTAIYKFTSSAADNTIDAAELQLIGVVADTLTAGNFSFA